MSRTMKDSGIEWIGDVPEEWEVKRLKDVCMQNPNTLSEKEDKELEFDYVDIGSVSFEKGVFKSEHYAFKDAPSRARRKAALGDLIMSSVRTYLRAIDIVNTKEKANYIYSTGFAVLTPFENIKYQYLSYISKSQYFLEQVGILSKGINYPSINTTDLMTISIVLPPLAEQHLIATFLDKKCSEIDSLIELQEQMIEELKAYKQSVITEAVTKGIRNEELGVRNYKDSGIECIGKIPTHWEVKLLRFVLDNLDYLREPISAEHRQRNNPIYDYYGASGVIDKIDYYNVDDTVLLIGEDGANLRMRNIPLIYKASGKFWVNNHAHILKPISDNYNYLAMLLEALDYSDFITGSAQPKLSQDNLKKVRLCIPPLAEQQAIADYLDKKCGEIDELITIKQQKIESLKEYKKSVIYEYVTGKKEP